MTENQVLASARTLDEDPLKRTERLWRESVLERARYKCSNCGSEDRLQVKMVLPIEAGGRYIDSNGIVFCRVCEMSGEAAASKTDNTSQRLINFWMSRSLYDRIQKSLNSPEGFSSMGALIRTLMKSFVSDPSRFDDLYLYQDEQNEVRVNVWVDRETYATFKTILDIDGKTVTESLRSLILMYQADLLRR